MKKLLLYGSLVLLVVFGVMLINYTAHLPSSHTAATPTPSPLQPTRLRIPSLNINAPVINVGTNATGGMDAPTSKAINSPYWTSVFWYAPGAAPGQVGNAVIAGHVDRAGGGPAIFWSLSNLIPGDDVFVRNMQGKELHFEVIRIVTYPANAPGSEVINAVFGPTTEHHLNLITCSGVWTGNGYDQRLVVFTTQMQ